jgi:Ca2+-binding RTX toxin-like protein
MTTITLSSTDPNQSINESNVSINGSGAFVLFIGGTNDVAALTGGDDTVQTLSGNTITTGAGNDTIEINGAGNVVDAGGGSNIIWDTGSSDTFVMPTAGNGLDRIYAQTGGMCNDTIDMRALLAATSWNGSASTLNEYLRMKTSQHGGNAMLMARDTPTGTFHAVAVFEQSGPLKLSTVLAHAIT